MGQIGGPVPTFNAYPGGTSSKLNITATGVVKAAPGTLYTLSLVAVGTTSGGITLSDSNALVTAQTITGITQASQAVVTVSTGGGTNPFAVGNTIAFASVGGMTQINSVIGSVVAIGGVTTAWTITTNINSSSYSAWTSGGTAASYSAANEITSIPYNATNSYVGSTFFFNWPCLNGILVSAVAGGGSPQYSIAYA